tara:strand:+ start:551 stop:832 length:282 start_codon:yes stop_codon:yes gene_type:complete
VTPLEWLDEAQLADHMAVQFSDGMGGTGGAWGGTGGTGPSGGGRGLAVATPRTPFGALRRCGRLRAVQKGAKGWKQIAAALGIGGGRTSTLDD